MVKAGKIAEIIGAKVLSFYTDTPIIYLLLDSRKVIVARDSVFFAIKGSRHDGHQYIRTLYEKGVRNFILEAVAAVDPAQFPEATFWQVGNAVYALQKLAGYHRSQFSVPVIGVTGSNGKTIVKEWLALLLHKNFKIVKSPKSYNSQIGVPLSVWALNSSHSLGIFEAGISQPDEMQNLAAVIQPTLGIFTTIGPAHDEGFKSVEEKITEKLKLFAASELVFYRKDYAAVHTQLLTLNYKTFNWSTKEKADLQVLSTAQLTEGLSVNLNYLGKSFGLIFPLSDEGSFENLMHCICVLLYFNLSTEEIQLRLNAIQPIAMRLELKEGVNGCQLIDDTYNNDFSGLSIAVNFLDQQKQRIKKTVILSDLLETGIEEEQLYKQLAEMFAHKGITRLVGIGETISRNRRCFDFLPTSFFESTEAFLAQLNPKEYSNELILIKGARVFAFEKIIRLLQQKIHGTVLEINLDALAHNLNFYKSQLKEGTKVMAMVKAFAYGTGSFEIANLLQFHRADYLAVAYADEGVALRENGITLPIMVMNPSKESFAKLIHYELEPEIYSFKIAVDFFDFLRETKLSATIHLKLDTGMRRLGFEEKQLEALLELLSNTSFIRVASVFTHLAAADEAVHNDFTKEQLSSFNRMADSIEDALGYKTIRHALNSAGIVRFPEAQMGMVRLGIGLYGVEASGLKQSELMTVGTLKTIISQIKKVSKGDSVGYSRKGLAASDTTIATIAIGYADGFDRGFGNGVGTVLINGKECPMIGNICMDMCMVDITGVEASEGDEVIVFGEQLSIVNLAKKIGTIPYELLTGIGERVKRVFFTA